MATTLEAPRRPTFCRALKITRRTLADGLRFGYPKLALFTAVTPRYPTAMPGPRSAPSDRTASGGSHGEFHTPGRTDAEIARAPVADGRGSSRACFHDRRGVGAESEGVLVARSDLCHARQVWHFHWNCTAHRFFFGRTALGTGRRSDPQLAVF